MTLCELPGGAPRFVTGTTVALLSPGIFRLLDLISGVESTILTYSPDDGAVASWDWTSDGRVFAYSRLTSDLGSIVFHLVTDGTDRVLATVSAPSVRFGGAARIEFSPDGRFVALGAPSSVTTGESAAVQVRRLDGSLVFSSGGTGAQTWAGESPKLYFEGPTGVETWDPTHGVSRLPIAHWSFPTRSAGGRWLAYQVPATYWADLRIIDTRSGADRAIGRASQDVAWVRPTLMRFDEIVSCPSPLPRVVGYSCTTRRVIYDTYDGSTTITVPAHVFDAWPKGTQPWY